MVSIQDFFGGSKRRAALQLLDRSLSGFEVNPAYIDDGMRFAIYRWAQEAAAGTMSESGVMDGLMREAAALISFCVIGPAETEATWGAAVRAEREARLDAVVASGDEESFDAKLIKLVLAKEIAAPDIMARVSLEEDGER
jgi:hypothetical protein